jgi:D-sedoheptulose 7-phosphate isomerase
MADLLALRLAQSLETIQQIGSCLPTLTAISEQIASCFADGGTLYLCGNGGSAADAQHIAAEFVGRFLRERRALPAIALTCNTSILTAIGNDYDFSQIFARQVLASVRQNDIVVGISTSGNSVNVLEALRAAREINAGTIGFTGVSGGELAQLCDTCFRAPSDSTPRIQECHLVAWHLICESVENTESLSSHATIPRYHPLGNLCPPNEA